jgi:aminodeoxyfutalosine synthase
VERVKALDSALISEVHIVNGLNPDLPFSYYTDLLIALKQARPELHLKGFTAVEIAYYAEKYGMSIDAVLDAMTAAGLDSMPGGGAEIFAPRARKKLCHDKVDGAGWLEIHRIAHRKGIRTNATMLFGSIETTEERVDHLCQLRALQDRSLQDGATDPDHAGGRFQTFIPLRFHNDNNRLERLASPTGFDSLRTIALSRLMLDNFAHIKAYWPMLGTQVAQVAQHFGSSDLDGTVREEHIYHMAGADTPQGHTPEQLAALIRRAQRNPVERDTLYHVIRRLDAPVSRAESTVNAPQATIGVVGYRNALPLTRHLDTPNLKLRQGHPSEVATWLREGEVDLALLPVAALLHDRVEGSPDPGFRVIPDLAISCDGPVDSVLIASEEPIEAWTQVLLDGVSRTSVCLARLLLRKGPLADRVRSDLELLETAPGTGVELARGTRATVVIGDQALDLPERLRYRLDLGKAWKDWTGLPFVFALWTGRAGLDPRLVEQVRSAGLQGIKELREGLLDEHMDVPTQNYLKDSIRYILDDRSTMGLMRFASMAHQSGLLAREHFSLFPPASWSCLPEVNCTAALQELLQGHTDLETLSELAEHAPLLELVAAAGLENAPERSVSYQVLSDQTTGPSMVPISNLGGLMLGAAGVEGEFSSFEQWLQQAMNLSILDLHIAPGPETSASHWARLFMGLRESEGPYIRALSIRDSGTGKHPHSTGVEWLGIIALARLSCPMIPHILVEVVNHGPGLTQLALHSGATDLGTESTTSDAHGAALERHIRRAGFDPVRRNGHWELLRGGLSQAEDPSRPLRRLDSPIG